MRVLVGVMVLALGGCSAIPGFRSIIDKVIYNAPRVEVQQVPESPEESKVSCGSYIITRDANGHIVKVESKHK